MNSSMHSACIALGSNLGDSLQLLLRGWQALGEHPEIDTRCLSSPYRTDPVGMESSNRFINAAGLLETSLEPEALLRQLLAVERQFGRTRAPQGHGYQDRTLDLDLLLFDQLVLDTLDLALPHPRMQERLFVLAPLAEIAPTYYHPVLKKSVRELYQTFRNTTHEELVERCRWPGRSSINTPKERKN